MSKVHTKLRIRLLVVPIGRLNLNAKRTIKLIRQLAGYLGFIKIQDSDKTLVLKGLIGRRG